MATPLLYLGYHLGYDLCVREIPWIYLPPGHKCIRLTEDVLDVVYSGDDLTNSVDFENFIVRTESLFNNQVNNYSTFLLLLLLLFFGATPRIRFFKKMIVFLTL